MNNWRQYVKYWKAAPRQIKHILCLICLLVALFLPTRISSDCIYEFEGYSFVNPLIIAPALDFAPPYYLSIESLYNMYKKKGNLQESTNIKEWKERFCNKAKYEDIEKVIYGTTRSELEQLRTAARSTSIPLDFRLARNTFARHLERFDCREVIDYLIFAKRCEPYVLKKKSWDDEPLDVPAMQKLIKEGLETFRVLESQYVKLRYAYQVIRLAHYTKSYEQTLDLYEYLMPKIDNDPSIIEYWILGHKAGALMGLERTVEAAYLYLQVFQNCPGKRESAYRSFTIKNEEEWRECLIMCKDDDERATLHALRANAAESKALEDMYHIYELKPKSEHLELLMVKELIKLERDLLGYEFNDKKRANKRLAGLPRSFAGAYLLDVQDFVELIIEENKTDRLDFWKLIQGYLTLLSGNYYDATKAFADARRIIKNDTLKEQLQVFELALKISAFEKISESVEIELERIKKRSPLYENNEDFTDFLDDKLAYMYKIEGRPGKAFLHHYSLDQLKPNPSMDIVEDLLAICNEEKPNRFERQLVAKGDSTIKNDLIDIKATMFMANYDFEAALEVLKGMDRAEWDGYGLFYPFIEQTKDKMLKGLPDNVQVYNKGELIEYMLDMEYKARAGTENSAELYYQLGLAYYNMSYFGYSWKALDYYRSDVGIVRWQDARGDAADGFVLRHRYYPFGNREHFDCSMALYYFEKTRILAGNSELGLKATFMAAKCEQNIFYVEGGEQSYDYFELLKNNYRSVKDTSGFYEQIIRECKYFSTYVAN